MKRNNTDEGLKRELGIFDVATNVINITVGSGIFLLPALIAATLGNASILAYLVCGFMFLLVVLCYAEISSRISTSGGAYVYIERAFGPYFGFIANNLFWFGGVLYAAALVNGIADMLSVPFPLFEHGIYRILLFIFLISFVAYSNMAGLKQGMRLIKTVTVLKLAPLLLLIIVGLIKLQPHNLSWQGFPPIDALGIASLTLFSAFLGGETALNMSGEMKHPRRTAPLGLLFGVIGVILFYSLIHIVAQSALGDTLGKQKAPIAAVAGSLAGNLAVKALIICGVISIFGSLYSCIQVFSRVLFAGSVDGLLPAYLSKVHQRHATPHLAIITLSVIAVILACSGGFRQLLVVATISMTILYVGVIFALIKFKLTDNDEFPASFKLPAGLLIPILTLIFLTWFLFQSKQNEIIGAAIFIAVLTLLYLFKPFFKKTIGK